jgi:hypothetical protein
MIPALYRMHGNVRPSREEVLTPRWAAFERNMVDRVWASMNDGEPAIAIVETAGGGLDTRLYFERDARFRAWFASAVVLDVVGFYVVYGAPVGEIRPR